MDIWLFRRSWWRIALLFALMYGMGPVFAQPVPESTQPSKFQARIEAAAVALRESNPRFKGVSSKYVRGLAEFVSGNMLFVLLHEMAHVSITQMQLPVLRKLEDADDTYAAL